MADRGKRIAAAFSIALGLIVGGAAWVLVGAPDSIEAEARVRLVEDEVPWPYGQSIMEAQQTYLAQDDVRSQIAEAAGLQLDQVKGLDSTLSRGTAVFSVLGQAENSADAVALTDSAVTWLVANNLAERSGDLAAELEANRSRTATIESELAVAEQALTEFDEGSPERIEAGARFAALVTQQENLDAKAADIEQRTELLGSQLEPLSPATPAPTSNRRLATALTLGLGTAILAFASSGAIGTRL